MFKLFPYFEHMCLRVSTCTLCTKPQLLCSMHFFVYIVSNSGFSQLQVQLIPEKESDAVSGLEWEREGEREKAGWKDRYLWNWWLEHMNKLTGRARLSQTDNMGTWEMKILGESTTLPHVVTGHIFLCYIFNFSFNIQTDILQSGYKYSMSGISQVTIGIKFNCTAVTQAAHHVLHLL